MSRVLVVSAFVFLAACSQEAPEQQTPLDPAAAPASYIIEAVNDRGRPEADLVRDAGRHPAEMLAFAGVQPGWRVADLGAGSGYYSRILSTAVGSDGEVIAENMDWIVDRFPAADDAITAFAEERDNVTRLVSPIAGILDGYDSELDAAFMVLIYHDQAWQQDGFHTPTREDRLAMNRSIYDALRPGGVFLVVDHHAIEGAADTDVDAYHRIEEAFVREEVEIAGFVLEATSDLLANPEDPRDISVFDETIRGQTDRFVLLFRKPD
ncbi:class I SAM-dependent methyltransferase [Hyphobacterium sp.]|uniref:class I SAM-dependent methyltransferase n=1 Tax=Hyphobacterium sp. TaxID=2004662 RepID=UPI003BA86877